MKPANKTLLIFPIIIILLFLTGCQPFTIVDDCLSYKQEYYSGWSSAMATNVMNACNSEFSSSIEFTCRLENTDNKGNWIIWKVHKGSYCSELANQLARQSNECTAAGRYWYNDMCNEKSLEEINCEAQSKYWYDNSCHILTQSQEQQISEQQRQAQLRMYIIYGILGFGALMVVLFILITLLRRKRR